MKRTQSSCCHGITFSQKTLFCLVIRKGTKCDIAFSIQFIINRLNCVLFFRSLDLFASWALDNVRYLIIWLGEKRGSFMIAVSIVFYYFIFQFWIRQAYLLNSLNQCRYQKRIYLSRCRTTSPNRLCEWKV